jgi:hypothetical protein
LLLLFALLTPSAAAAAAADSELRKVREDHSAAERKLAELRVEKERVARQVRITPQRT